SFMISPPSLSTLFPYTTLFRSFLVKVNKSNDFHSSFQRISSKWRHGFSPLSLMLLSSSPFAWLLESDQGSTKPSLHERKKPWREDRKSTRLNSSHVKISYAVFC